MKPIVKLFLNFAFGAFIVTNSLVASVVSASTPVLALDGSNNGVGIWQAWDNSGKFIIRGATMTAGGSWKPAVTLSSLLSDSFFNSPQASQCLSVNSAGDAVAVWASYNGSNNDLYASRMIGLSSWESPATRISDGIEDTLFNDTVVRINNSQQITVVYTSLVSGNPVMRSVSGTTGSWSPPVTIDP